MSHFEDLFETLAANPPATPLPVAEIERLAQRHHRQRTRSMWATTAAAAVMFFLFGVVALRSGPVDYVSSGSPGSTTGPSPSAVGQSSPDTTPPGAVFLELDPAVSQYALTQVHGPNGTGGGGGSSEWTTVERWVRFDPTGSIPVDLIDLQIGPSTGSLSSFHGTETSVRGHEGMFTDNGPASGPTGRAQNWLTWIEYPGTVVVVGAALDEAGLQALAARLGPSSDGLVTFVDPPPGYEQVAKFPGMTGYSGLAWIAYQRPDGHGFLVQIQSNSNEPPGIDLYRADSRRLRIAGKEAVLTPQPFSSIGTGGHKTFPLMTDTPNLTLLWMAEPTTRIVLKGYGLTADELVDIGNHLRRIDATRWAQLRSSAPPDPEPGSTGATFATTPPTVQQGQDGEPSQTPPQSTSAPQTGSALCRGWDEVLQKAKNAPLNDPALLDAMRRTANLAPPKLATDLRLLADEWAAPGSPPPESGQLMAQVMNEAANECGGMRVGTAGG